MSKADNYNESNYGRTLGENYTEQRQYIIPESKVWVWGLDQKFSYKVWIKSLDWVKNLILKSWCRKINSRAIFYRIW